MHFLIYKHELRPPSGACFSNEAHMSAESVGGTPDLQLNWACRLRLTQDEWQLNSCHIADGAPTERLRSDHK